MGGEVDALDVNFEDALPLVLGHFHRRLILYQHSI